MKLRPFLATIVQIASISAAFLALEARADINLQVVAPAAPSTVAKPLTVQLFNLSGIAVPPTVNVTNILAGDTPNADAVKIYNAILAQNPAFAPATAPTGAIVSVTNTNKMIIVDPTRESLDKINLNQYPAYQYSQTALSGSATGLNDSSGASLVQAGIDGGFIAQVSPTAGESASTILSQLSASLVSHGITASYDPVAVTLNVTLLPTQTFDYGNTDTGFQVSEEISTGQPVPAMPAWALASLAFIVVGAGLFCLGQKKYKRVG
jgi:hypothetical protein